MNMGHGMHKCSINGILSKCVNFEKGDLLKDIDSLSMDNAVLMFRNVWPYLPFCSEFDLMRKMAKTFKTGSTLVIGDYDKFVLACNTMHYNLLNDYGFKEIKPLIFQKKI